MERTARARLVYSGIDESGESREAEVRLEYRDNVVTGRVGCERGDLLATALATLEAARELARHPLSCTLKSAETTEVFGSRYALVNGTLFNGGRAVPVLGSAAIRGATTEAIARATLDALNRWLDVGLEGARLEGFDELEEMH